MKKIFLSLVIIICLSFFQIYAVDLSGNIRNDAILLYKNNLFSYSNILENQLILARKTEYWRYHSDIRLLVFTGKDSAGISSTVYLLSVPRIYIKYFFSPEIDITIGKNNISLGNIGLFNPFETDKTVNTADVNYDKSGITGFIINIGIADKSLLKAFGAPSPNPADSSWALDISTNVSSFDIGCVVLRKPDDTSAGFYFKGDIELGVSGSMAYHFYNGSGDFLETNLGTDYSFFDGKLFSSLLFYYNQKGSDTSAALNTPITYSGFFHSKLYMYFNSLYTYDEFLSFGIGSIGNLSDGSAVIFPSVSYLISDGLTLSLQYNNATGNDKQEFSGNSLGSHSIIFKVNGKL